MFIQVVPLLASFLFTACLLGESSASVAEVSEAEVRVEPNQPSAASSGDRKQDAPEQQRSGPSTDSEGWTELEPGAASRLIYVSSSEGDDVNDGRSPESPKKTLQVAIDLLRPGQPDWVLLKKGDIWEEGRPGSAIRWTKSGHSAEQPAVITSYGEADAGRPLIRTGGQVGIQIQSNRRNSSQLRHVAIVGIELSAEPRDVKSQNPTGALFRAPVENLLVEDCKFTGFKTGITIQGGGGTPRDVRIRRNVIADCYDGNHTHAQGMYCTDVAGLLIEENVIDHGGWSEEDPDAFPPDIFKHNIYVQSDCESVVVRGNILSNASSHGLQLRSGGICEENLFLRNSIAVLFVRSGHVRRNVILDGKDITPKLERRQAMHFDNLSECTVSGNVIANSEPCSRSKGISIAPLRDKYTKEWRGVESVSFVHNIVYNWGGRTLDIRDFGKNDVPFSDVVFRDNDFQNMVDAAHLVAHYCETTTAGTKMEGNRFFSQRADPGDWIRIARSRYRLEEYKELVGDDSSTTEKVRYPDPERTAASYNKSLGGVASHDAFMAEALKQSKANWRPAYTARAFNDYVRVGFGLTD